MEEQNSKLKHNNANRMMHIYKRIEHAYLFEHCNSQKLQIKDVGHQPLHSVIRFGPPLPLPLPLLSLLAGSPRAAAARAWTEMRGGRSSRPPPSMRRGGGARGRRWGGSSPAGEAGAGRERDAPAVAALQGAEGEEGERGCGGGGI
jgi:hypothetical protein